MNEQVKTAETAKPARRRRASLTALQTKLAAPARPGYVRRWVDNDPSRIQAMQELGYEPVQDKDIPTDGLGTRAQRFGGKRANGEPQHLVLMETPESDYAQGIREKEESLKPFEDALRAGRDTQGRLQDTYEPRDRSSLT
jgi:hypothetical protein